MARAEAMVAAYVEAGFGKIHLDASMGCAGEPPLQLLLGADAMVYATRQLAAFQTEIGRWAKLTLSTGFSD